MDVFLMIRRKKLTIFTDCKDSTTVGELKKIIEGILKVSPENMQLYRENQVMGDDDTLSAYQLTSSTARAQSPAAIGLAIRMDSNDDFEKLDITPYSVPPDLPDVMKAQEGSGPEAAA